MAISITFGIRLTRKPFRRDSAVSGECCRGGNEARVDNDFHIVNSVPESPVIMPRIYVAGGCSNKASAYASLHKFPVDDVKRCALLESI